MFRSLVRSLPSWARTPSTVFRYSPPYFSTAVAAPAAGSVGDMLLRGKDGAGEFTTRAPFFYLPSRSATLAKNKYILSYFYPLTLAPSPHSPDRVRCH